MNLSSWRHSYDGCWSGLKCSNALLWRFRQTYWFHPNIANMFLSWASVKRAERKFSSGESMCFESFSDLVRLPHNLFMYWFSLYICLFTLTLIRKNYTKIVMKNSQSDWIGKVEVQCRMTKSKIHAANTLLIKFG